MDPSQRTRAAAADERKQARDGVQLQHQRRVSGASEARARGGASWTGAGRALVNGLALLLLLATSLGVASTVPGAARAGQVDFITFLDSAELWRQGLPFYQSVRLIPGDSGAAYAHPNLNHPAVALLMAPLTALSRHDAFLLWAVFGAVCYLLAVALHDDAGWEEVYTGKVERLFVRRST